WCLYYLFCRSSSLCFFFFFFNATPTTEIYTLSLHDALPISRWRSCRMAAIGEALVRENAGRCDQFHEIHRPSGICGHGWTQGRRSEEHTSELQSRRDLVCRLLLEKKKTKV